VDDGWSERDVREALRSSEEYAATGGPAVGFRTASADRIIPADIPDHLRDGIQKMARQIFTLFGAAGVARLDFLIQKDEGTVYFNEINTIPGSFSLDLWEEDGMNMKELMLQLIDISIGQHRKKAGRIRSYETNLLSEKAVRGIKGSKGDAS
jgi:D-alanine-D-alanine ligase